MRVPILIAAGERVGRVCRVAALELLGLLFLLFLSLAVGGAAGSRRLAAPLIPDHRLHDRAGSCLADGRAVARRVEPSADDGVGAAGDVPASDDAEIVGRKALHLPILAPF